MNKVIALFCAAILAITSSAAIVMADETASVEDASVEEIVDTPAEITAGGDGTGDAALTDTEDTDIEQTDDTDTEDTDQTIDTEETDQSADTDQTSDIEHKTDTSDDKGSDAGTESKSSAETPAPAEAPSQNTDDSQPSATSAPSSSRGGSGGGNSAAATAEPESTADPSATAEPTAAADPLATAAPEATEAPEKKDVKSETKTITVMKKPFTLVKSYADNPFEDCQSGWFKNYVSFAYANGIIKGYNDNTFDPNGKITGTQLAVMLYRITTGKADMVTEGNAWSDEAMAWVKTNGIMADFADEDFDGDEYLTREEIICSFHRAYSLYNKAAEGGEIDTDRFPDAGDVSKFALPAMEWAVASKIITGKSDKWIDPLSNVTRAETATIFERYLENLDFAEVPVEVKTTVSKEIDTDTAASTDSAETESAAAEEGTETETAETEAAAEEAVPETAEPETPAESAEADE